jgi:hypothetical protein
MKGKPTLLAGVRRLSLRRATIFGGGTALVGIVVLVVALAAAAYALFEPGSGSLSGGATVVSNSSASGGQAVKFGSGGTPTPGPTCHLATPNVPDGPDPWGGCFPGPTTTGVPAGATLTNYTGDCDLYNSDNLVIDHEIINCSMLNYSHNVTITNSRIVGAFHNNSSNASVTIQDSEIDGGNDNTEDVGWRDITLLRDNLHGNQHTINCGGNCVVRDSWTHDQYPGAARGAHQNGFFSNGGSNYSLIHNSFGCFGTGGVAGCTSDVAFLNGGAQDSADIENNLLLASSDPSFCVYPGPDSSTTTYPPVTNFTWKNNVFQRGSNSLCATYGPVYGWFPTAGTNSGNVWSGNVWDNGAALNP